MATRIGIGAKKPEKKNNDANIKKLQAALDAAEAKNAELAARVKELEKPEPPKQ